MELIEVLEDGQGLLGGVGVLLVGVPLELGEVVGRRGRGLPAGALEAGHHPLLPRQPGGQRLAQRLGLCWGVGYIFHITPRM